MFIQLAVCIDCGYRIASACNFPPYTEESIVHSKDRYLCQYGATLKKQICVRVEPFAMGFTELVEAAVARAEELKKSSENKCSPGQFRVEFEEFHGHCTTIFNMLREEGSTQDELAETLANACVDLWSCLGPLRPPNIAGFTRGVFKVGRYNVFSMQFYQWKSFYPKRYPSEPSGMDVLYQWTFYDGKILDHDKVIQRFYLERSYHPTSIHVVGTADVSLGWHASIKNYYSRQPTFSQCEETITAYLRGDIEPVSFSIKAGSQCKFSPIFEREAMIARVIQSLQKAEDTSNDQKPLT